MCSFKKLLECVIVFAFCSPTHQSSVATDGEDDGPHSQRCSIKKAFGPDRKWQEKKLMHHRATEGITRKKNRKARQEAEVHYPQSALHPYLLVDFSAGEANKHAVVRTNISGFPDAG